MADDVQLTDLEVIQKYSLAVRGATASRADVVAALESDLAFLTGGRRNVRGAAVPTGSTKAAAGRGARTAPAVSAAPEKAPVKTGRSRKA